jgi:thiamine-phosphate pyrophosphorylase
MPTFSLSGLYGITDATLMPDTQTMLNACEAAIAGGMKVLQYRDKSNNSALRLDQASALRALCKSHGSLTEARQRLGKTAIIGQTCHDRLELAIRAQAEGANYVAFGAFFPSNTKPGASPAPLSLLSTARAQLSVPMVAIGGLSVDNATQVIAAGADMTAVVHALFAAQDIRTRAEQFSRLFRIQAQDH